MPTYPEYWTEIETIADDLVATAMEESGNDREQAEHDIDDHMLVDLLNDHQWMADANCYQDIAKHTENNSYMIDMFGHDEAAYIVEKGGLDAFVKAIAFWCIFGDVMDQIEGAFDAFEANLNIGRI